MRLTLGGAAAATIVGSRGVMGLQLLSTDMLRRVLEQL